MAINNVTIDFDKLEVFHPAKLFPEIVDQYFSAYPVASLFYKTALAGSLEGAMAMKSMTDYFTGKASPRFKNQQFLKGNAHIEIPISFAALSGTVNGAGVQSITNTPANNKTKARFGLNKKYTPVALEEFDYSLAQAGMANGDLEMYNRTVNDMNDAAGNALMTQLEEIENQILGTGTDEEDGVLSLAAAFGTSATDNTTYGSILRSSITAWRGNFDAVTDANWLDPTSADFCVAITSYWEDVVISNGAKLENLVWLMGDTKFQYYRRATTIGGVTSSALSVPLYRRMLGEGTDLPHTNLATPGGVPIVRAAKAGASTAYLVDTDSTFMVGVPDHLFKLLNWSHSEEKTQLWSRMHTFSNVVTKAPRRNVYIAAS